MIVFHVLSEDITENGKLLSARSAFHHFKKLDDFRVSAKLTVKSIPRALQVFSFEAEVDFKHLSKSVRVRYSDLYSSSNSADENFTWNNFIFCNNKD